MKRVYFLYLIVFTTILCSCSHKTGISENLDEYETIKSVVNEKNQDIKWSDELDPDRLTKSLAIDEKKVAKEVESQPLMMVVSNIYNAKVYPELEGFYSLNTNEMNASLLKFTDDFCDSFSKKNIYKDLSHFYNSKFSFNSTLFVNDFVLSYEKNLDRFPYNEDSTEEDLELFQKYVIGKAVLSDNFYEIPVRFYCKTSFVDLTLYVKDSVPYELFDIKIIGWENDGKRKADRD